MQKCIFFNETNHSDEMLVFKILFAIGKWSV